MSIMIRYITDSDNAKYIDPHAINDGLAEGGLSFNWALVIDA